jgi:hypothetical protein
LAKTTWTAASPATTLSIYAHMFERTDAKAAAAINAALDRR